MLCWLGRRILCWKLYFPVSDLSMMQPEKREISEGTKRLVVDSGGSGLFAGLGALIPKAKGRIFVGILPYLHCLLLYAIAPGFIAPFFLAPVAQLLLVVLVCWQLLGFYWLLRTDNFNLQILIGMIGTIPLMLAPMLGPAILTILMALRGI